jgi:hypothetical protein
LLSADPEASGAGPALRTLIETQRANEEATAFPRIAALARALGELSEALGAPLVWPVGEAADRLAGAAVLASAGEMRVRGWTDDIRGERVLLATVAAVTPLGLVEAAKHARALGASEVHACGLEVPGLDSPDLHDVFDSRGLLAVRNGPTESRERGRSLAISVGG